MNKSLVALDTNVIIAGLMTWHEHHGAARRAVEEVLRSGDGVLPIPALLESYSVMTRLPARHRLSPEDALRLLKDNFQGSFVLAGFDPADSWDFLADMAQARVAGGRVHDASILRCARGAGARTLLTFNTRDLISLGDEAVEIRDPR